MSTNEFKNIVTTLFKTFRNKFVAKRVTKTVVNNLDTMGKLVSEFGQYFSKCAQNPATKKETQAVIEALANNEAVMNTIVAVYNGINEIQAELSKENGELKGQFVKSFTALMEAYKPDAEEVAKKFIEAQEAMDEDQRDMEKVVAEALAAEEAAEETKQ